MTESTLRAMASLQERHNLPDSFVEKMQQVVLKHAGGEGLPGTEEDEAEDDDDDDDDDDDNIPSSGGTTSTSDSSRLTSDGLDSAEVTLPMGHRGGTGIAAALHKRQVQERIAAEQRLREELHSRLAVTEEQLKHAAQRCHDLKDELGQLAREKDAVEETYRVRDEQMRHVAEQTSHRLERLEKESLAFRESIKDSIHQHLFVGPEAAALLRSKRPEQLDLIEYIQLRVHDRLGEEYRSRDASGIEVTTLLRDLEYARSEADRVKLLLEDRTAAFELLKEDAAKCNQRSTERIAKLESDYDALAVEMESDRSTTRGAYKVREELEERRAQVTELDAERVLLAKRVEVLQEDVRQSRRDVENDVHRAQHHATEVRYLAKENESLASRVQSLEEEKHTAQTTIRTLQDTMQANLDKYGADILAVREKHDLRLQEEMERMEQNSTREIRRIQEHTKAIADREYAQVRTEKEIAQKESDRLTRRLEEVEGEGRRVQTELRLSEERMRGELSSCRTDLKTKALECGQLREVRQQDEMTISGLNLDCSRLQKMLDTLKNEFFELQLSHSRQHEEMRARVTTLREQLKIYEDLETECDDAIENTGRLLTDAHSGEVATQLLSNVPSSAGRRIQQSLLLAKRAMNLENQVALLKEELQQKTSSSDRISAELNRVRGVMGSQGQPYQYFVDTLAKKDADIEALKKRYESVEREHTEFKQENERMRDIILQMQSQMEVLKGQRDELSGYLQEHLHSSRMVHDEGLRERQHHRGSRRTARRRTVEQSAPEAPMPLQPPPREGPTVIFGAPPRPHGSQTAAVEEEGTSVMPQPFVISA